ncbi:MAG: DUF1080 domain-containing protein [Myxococcales bacterium]|nr:DUF1080 domain-containing protein [Myxococcales bacterium]
MTAGLTLLAAVVVVLEAPERAGTPPILARWSPAGPAAAAGRGNVPPSAAASAGDAGQFRGVQVAAAPTGRALRAGPAETPTPDADGQSALPAGTATPAPFEATEPAGRSPLRRYTGRNIVLMTDTRHEYAQDLLLKLDSFMQQAAAAIARVLDTQSSPRPTQIIVFESQERYQDHAREHAPGLVNNGGYYDGGMRTVVTYRYNNSMQLYFHELVHAMMGEQFNDHHFSRYTRRHWPIWFDEGMSEYLGSFEVQGAGIRIPAPNKGKLAYLANAMAQGVFIDLVGLLRAPPDRFSGVSMNIYYAESWGLLDHLLASPVTRGRVPLFFRKIRSGEDGLQAFKTCFGEDLGLIDAAWRAHIYAKTRPPAGWVPLFSGESIDDWTVHEGGQWKAAAGEISGAGDRNYNYLIKSEIPMTDFAYELELNIQRGTAGLILGNNFHGEYPYYYLIDVARDAVMLRRAYSSSQIEPVIQAWAEVPLGEWVRLRVTVIDRVLRLHVGGREVLQARVDRERYSLFGLYLYRARVRFRGLQLRRELPERALAGVPSQGPTAGGPAEPAPGWTPAGNPAASAAPRAGMAREER